MENKKAAGFTLLEILIALFIFTVLSMMLASTLHNVINLQSHVEANATRLRKLQIGLLIFSRDIQQAVNRPVLNSFGKEENAFIGTPQSFTFTHAGVATQAGDSTGAGIQSTLQRTRYMWSSHVLWRMTWETLDQTPESRPHSRSLLADVTDVHFQYLDKEGHFLNRWQEKQQLPRAIRLFLTISNWGKLSQLYVISTNSHTKSLRPLSKP
jgi:general secretion pathway protein J